MKTQSTIKPRSTRLNALLMSKRGGAHGKSRKAERRADKMSLGRGAY